MTGLKTGGRSLRKLFNMPAPHFKVIAKTHRSGTGEQGSCRMESI